MRSGFSGHQRKALIRSLDARPALDRGRKADRPQQYGQEAVAALKAVWEASDRACGKRLRPFLPELVGVLERHGKLVLDRGTRNQVEAMRTATCCYSGSLGQGFSRTGLLRKSAG